MLVGINREYDNVPAEVEKKNSLWGAMTKPKHCMVLILLSSHAEERT